MNKRTLIFVGIVLFLAAAFQINAAINDAALGNPTTVKVDSTTNTVKMDATTNTVRQQPIATTSSFYGNSSTTSILLSPLANRRQVVFKVNAADKSLTVNVGAATAVAGTGFVVTASFPLVLDVGPAVPISYIAADAHSIAILQTGY